MEQNDSITNSRDISDSKWMDLLRSKYNTNFYNEPPEIIIPVNRELIILDKYKKIKEIKVTKPKKIKTIQFSLEI